MCKVYKIILPILLAYGLFGAANDQDSIAHNSHKGTSVLASANPIEYADEGASVSSDPDENPRMAALNAARKAYYESVPSNLRPSLEAYSKAIDESNLADKDHKKHMDKYFLCISEKAKILDDLVSILTNLNSDNLQIIELIDLAFVFKETDKEPRTGEEIPLDSDYYRARNAINKALLNTNLHIDSPDFSGLTKCIRQYRAAVGQATILETTLDDVCSVYYAILDIYKAALDIIKGSYIAYYEAGYIMLKIDADLKAYNRFLSAKNAFESYRDTAA